MTTALFWFGLSAGLLVSIGIVLAYSTNKRFKLIERRLDEMNHWMGRHDEDPYAYSDPYDNEGCDDEGCERLSDKYDYADADHDEDDWPNWEDEDIDVDNPPEV